MVGETSHTVGHNYMTSTGGLCRGDGTRGERATECSTDHDRQYQALAMDEQKFSTMRFPASVRMLSG